MYMLVCGFFQPTQLLPAPVWLYPLHYMSYHTYSFFGFMRNEFEGTDGWLCPCYAQATGCGPAYETTPCTMTGEEVGEGAGWDVGGGCAHFGPRWGGGGGGGGKWALWGVAGPLRVAGKGAKG